MCRRKRASVYQSEDDGSSRAGVVQDAIEANEIFDVVVVSRESGGMAKQSSSMRMMKEVEAKAGVVNNSELEVFLFFSHSRYDI